MNNDYHDVLLRMGYFFAEYSHIGQKHLAGWQTERKTEIT